ncbi:MAG: class I tRNA ligase family protein, partial [Acidobacteria bacterium]|nr:class I tRNA ligase family protein [Acidobacteriota bacterium]
VGRTYEEAAKKATVAGKTIKDEARDPDVLDTWFSSALWPFSTLGWPDQTEDLKTFYPTSLLVTARDIIFLWVSRMMMTGLRFMGEKAFDDVFITGTIFDKHGQRMSKTKGNGVDPLEVFDSYGVDATRLVLASIGTTDTRWNDKQCESYRNFANKIWNATRFCLMNSEGASVRQDAFGEEREKLALHDRWILSRLNRTAREVNDWLEKYAFHEAVQTLYHFFWDDFCDWYIELTKAEISSEEASAEREAARSRILTVLEQALRLLHPFMPYITEELWLSLPGVDEKLLHPAYQGASATVMLTSYPRGEEALIDARAEDEMQAVIDLISRVRNIRSEMNIKPSERVPLLIGATDESLRAVFAASTEQIARIARVSDTNITEKLDAPRASARAVLGGGAELAIPLEGLIDFAQERERLSKEQAKLRAELERLEKQLSNPQFVERAPAEKVEELRQRVADINQRLSALEQNLEAFA